MAAAEEPIETMASLVRGIKDSMKIAFQKRPPELGCKEPKLLAVSKTKPTAAIIEAYELGLRYFGENYVQELEEKATDQEILNKCSDIRWHYIGRLQRNKVNKVTALPNLHCVETVDSDKLATALDSSWKKLNKNDKLRVMIQINTSNETNKSGIKPNEVIELVQHLKEKCPHLNFVGLMTIGFADHDIKSGPNPDFKRLVSCRQDVCNKFGYSMEDVDLSMGMSHDFEHAIEMGSTNVRVGSLIFGQRTYPKGT